MPEKRASSWVFAVIAVLIAVAALAWTAVAVAKSLREAAQQNQCMENLRLLGRACEMYQNDWHGVLVPYGAPFAWAPNGTMWPELLKPYLGKTAGSAKASVRVGRVFVCPSADPEEEDPCGLDRYYGINALCGGWMPKGKPVVVSLKSVRFPQATIMIAEVRWLEIGATGFAAKPSEFVANDPTCHMFAARHRGRGNVLWIDGHVSSMTLEQYNLRDEGPDDGNVWLRLEGPKPPRP